MFRRHCLTISTSAASVFTSLLLSQTLLPINTPFIESQRNHSDSESDDEHLNKEKEEQQQSKEMSKPSISEAVKKARAEAAWGMFIGDSLSMPVHWYYNTADIKQQYGGWLTGFVAPHGKHPSSILRLSAVDGTGRGSTSSKNSLIGTIILHDKLPFWNGSSKNNHYHQGMEAGDNTLNCVMALHELQTMNRVDHDLIKPEREVRAAVLEDFISFMTTPGSHNDTYAESFIRALFKDWVSAGQPTVAEEVLEFFESRSKKLIQEHLDHNIAAIGSLVPAIPWIIRNAHKSEKECVQSVVDFIKLTHPVPSLISFVDVYTRLLHSVINGRDLKSEIMQVLGHSILGGPSNRDRILKVLDDYASIPKGSERRLELHQAMISRLGAACYIDGAFNSMLFLALEFHDDFEGGVLANANCGGENCGRGAPLGALLAAAASHHVDGASPNLKKGLHSLKPGIESALADMNQGF